MASYNIGYRDEKTNTTIVETVVGEVWRDPNSKYRKLYWRAYPVDYIAPNGNYGMEHAVARGNETGEYVESSDPEGFDEEVCEGCKRATKVLCLPTQRVKKGEVVYCRKCGVEAMIWLIKYIKERDTRQNLPDDLQSTP
jgi:hypothetical protein